MRITSAGPRTTRLARRGNPRPPRSASGRSSAADRDEARSGSAARRSAQRRSPRSPRAPQAWAVRAAIATNSAAALGAAAGVIALPARLTPRPDRHLRTRLVFRPCARATPEIDAPGSSQAARTLALSSSLWRRRGPELGCIGVHQRNRWTPSSCPYRREARWDSETLTIEERLRPCSPHSLQRDVILPRLIRHRDAHAYLGMDRNRFGDEVRPALTEIPIGQRGIAFDRHELDVWADAYIAARGRPSRELS